MTGKNFRKITYFLNAKYEKIYTAYFFKRYSNRGKQIIRLIIYSREGWNYIAAKESALLREITSKYNDNFSSLNGLHLLMIKI